MWPFTPKPPKPADVPPQKSKAEIAVTDSIPQWACGDWDAIVPVLADHRQDVIVRGYIPEQPQINAYYIGRYDGLSLAPQRNETISNLMIPTQNMLISDSHKHMVDGSRRRIESFYMQGYVDAIIILSQGIDPIPPIILQWKPEGYQDPEFSQHDWMQRKRQYTPIR